MKRRSPLQTLMSSVECVSLANGDIRVTGPEEGGGPGMMTRMAGAARMQRFLNSHLKAKR